MKLNNFLEKYKLGFLEKSFLCNVFYEDFGESGLDLIEPEVEFERDDGTGRLWRVDFILQTKKNKFAIECDGFNYHAPGIVSKDRFNDLESKETFLAQEGYQLIKLSKDQIIDEPHEAIFRLRRSVNHDKELFNLFSKRSDNVIRPHDAQIRALSAIDESRKKGVNKGIVVLATGLGKTFLTAFDIKEYKPKNILFVVHVEYILKQARNSFEKVLPERSNEMGFFTGKQKEVEGKNIFFATIQTINKKKNLELFGNNFFDYIVIDECHHSAARTYQNLLDYFEPNFLMGLTATPERMDNKDIYENFSFNLIFEMDQSQAIKEGYLSQIHYKAFKDNVDYSNIHFNGYKYDVSDLNRLLMIEKRDEAIIEKYSLLAKDKKTIGFCTSIEHANWCANAFIKQGYQAVAIHSKITDINSDSAFQDPKEIIDAFDNDHYQIVFVVDMLNEGVDIPDVECLLMLRPTESSVILTQQIGRGLRIAEGKKEILILDFIGNYKSAPRVLAGLGINKRPNDFPIHIDVDGKEIYYFDNDGKRVEFESDVVDIINFLQSRSSPEVDKKLLTQEWIDYGENIKELTSEGNNLYWSIGKKNNNVGAQLWALNFIKNTQYESNNELSEKIKNESKKSGSSLEGIRALIFSQLLGLVKQTNPFVLSDAYEYLISLTNEVDVKKVISDQFEKFYFYNDIFSLKNRHSENIREVDKLFKIYPIYFIYQLFYLQIQRGIKPFLTKFELEHFVFFSRDNISSVNVLDLINKYRNFKDKFELEKFLKQQSRMDSRIFAQLKNIIYFDIKKDLVELRESTYDSFIEKIESFNNLIEKDKLVKFEKENRDEYFKMLWSKENLIEYHFNHK